LLLYRAALPDDETLDLKAGHHKVHVLFGGTKLLTADSSDNSNDNSSSSNDDGTTAAGTGAGESTDSGEQQNSRYKVEVRALSTRITISTTLLLCYNYKLFGMFARVIMSAATATAAVRLSKRM
jgi:hypothetical protein